MNEEEAKRWEYALNSGCPLIDEWAKNENYILFSCDCGQTNATKDKCPFASSLADWKAEYAKWQAMQKPTTPVVPQEGETQ